MNDITGVTYDPATGQVILIGRKDLSLPPMNMDDLVVAIRTVYAGEDPGVSIEPVNPNTRDGKMKVRYVGLTANTRFGQIMFEADRYLKSLNGGEDTLTGEPMTPNVSCYRSETDLGASSNAGDIPWHRVWFLPDELVVTVADDDKSMVFDKASIKVEARFVRFENGQMIDITGVHHPVVDAFTQCLTKEYDAFAKQKAELQELVQLAKIVGIVKWLRDKNIPVDLSWVNDYQIEKVDTPLTTVGREVTRPNARGKFIAYGGVDLSKDPEYTTDDSGRVSALADTAVSQRPASAPGSWQFDRDGQTYTAVALNLAPAPIVGGYKARVDDLQVAVSGGLTVDFGRYYNSLNLKDSPLGPGWSFTPYALHFQENRHFAGVTGETKQYTITQQIALMTGSGQETFHGPRVDQTGQKFFLPETSSVYRGILPKKDGTYTLRRYDGLDMHFDTQGRLAAVQDENGNHFTYHYDDNGRLTAIADADGRGVMLSYNDASLLTKVAASDGRAISYGYDARGRLSDVRDAVGLLASYVYDADDRLVEIRDARGQALVKNRYDTLGRLLTQTDGAGNAITIAYPVTTGPVSYTDPAGNHWRRQYENGRLAQETDPLGNSARYGYDSASNLTGVTDARGNTTTFGYDQSGNLTQSQSPSGATTRIAYNTEARPAWVVNPGNTMAQFEYDGRGNPVKMIGGLQVKSFGADGSVTYDGSQAYTTALSYDDKGYLAAVTDVRGSTTRMEYDALGNPISAQAPDGGVTRLAYDDRSRLTAVTDPLGHRLSFGYDDRDRVTSLVTGAGTVRYEYDQLGNPVSVVDPLGNVTGYEYDLMSRLTGVTEPTGTVTRYQYDAAGNLTRILYPNGAQQRYEYDARGRLVSEVYTGGL